MSKYSEGDRVIVELRSILTPLDDAGDVKREVVLGEKVELTNDQVIFKTDYGIINESMIVDHTNEYNTQKRKLKV